MYRKTFALLFVLLFYTNSAIAQEDPKQRKIRQTEVKEWVDSIAENVIRNYVSEKMGTKMAEFIRAKQGKGAYSDMTVDQFGKQMTKDLRSISNDSHMSVYYDPRVSSRRESRIANKTHRFGEVSNFGHTKIELLKENIGYLKISHFTRHSYFDRAKKAVDGSMRVLQHSDAIIIDLRGNPGGFEEIVAYLVSYFVEGDGQLQKYYCRFLDQERSISITRKLPGKKMPKVPLYILVNQGTGSAAESFAYLMKHLKRATIIGEKTVGAGNGSTVFRISKEMVVQIATWETINAVTKTSWEKTGVIPHIKIESDQALDKATELAKPVAKARRADLKKQYKSALDALNQVLDNENGQADSKAISENLKACLDLGLMTESDINSIGYAYLDNHNKPKIAEVILKANTTFFPGSANVYDSYGDALVKNGKLQEAVGCYEKAIELGTKSNSEFLKTFKENLEKTQRRLKAKKSGGG